MKLKIFYALVAFLLPATSRAEDLEGALHDALDAQAKAPSEPPTLPDTASARAKFVQQNIAHGENGERERAAHAQKSANAAASHSDDAADTSSRSAQAAAASAAKSADGDSNAAAGQARAAEARDGNVPGSAARGGSPGNPPPGHGRPH